MKSISVSVGSDQKHYMIRWQSCCKFVLVVEKKIADGVRHNDHNIKSSKSIKSFWCEVGNR